MKPTPRILCLCLAAAAAALSPGAAPAAPPIPVAPPVSEQIIVDQFGWRAAAPVKVALFARPVKGQNAVGDALTYTPGAAFQVRRVSDGRTVFTGQVTAWHNGDVHSQSGDRIWSGDFSVLRTPGTFYVYDPKNGRRSDAFTLGDGVYGPVLRTSLRMFYYQRCGEALTPAFGGRWTHDACHVGPDQDHAAQLLQGGKPQGGVRDVSGGWHDAGDYSKYVPFLSSTLWDLMTAYDLNPAAFGDRDGIPESGNGVPDLLDEIKWETDWLLKMQRGDGAVFNRVTALSYDNGKGGPEHDVQPRYYTPATTWATATFAMATAHAARQFTPYGRAYPGYAARLRAASERAWAYLEANPQMLPTDGTDGAGKTAAAGGDSSAPDDKRRRVLAAAELFRTTGDARYRTYFDAGYADKSTADGGYQPVAAGYLDASNGLDLTQAYFTYATAPGATPDIVTRIKKLFRDTADGTVGGPYDRGEDPYHCFTWDGHYSWGSNEVKSHWARLVILARALGTAPDHAAHYHEIAEEYLHYFHGRNPLGEVYLSNMGAKGAKLTAGRSVQDPYHGWFSGTSRYAGAASPDGPAPGYLVGGPNQFFSKDWISPPHGEPPMKAFKDWSGAWNDARHEGENSWEITEPAIYYQAAYVLVLSQFCPPAGGR